MMNKASTTGRGARALTALLLMALALVSGSLPAAGQDVDVPEVPVIAVTPDAGSANGLTEWEQPRRPQVLGGRERQAILEQVSGGGAGGLPLMDNIQNSGKTPTLRQAILTVKRPWMVHRAFLSSEGAQRVDARSVLSFDEAVPGRAVVGLNLMEGQIYLIDFLLQGRGAGDFLLTTSAGVHTYPDPDAKRNHVLIALKADRSGWAEISLSRTAGGFDLHSVEATLAVGPKN